MLELLIRLELRRQALRRKLLGMFRQDGDSYFGIIFIVLGLFLVFPGSFLATPQVAAIAIVLSVLCVFSIFTIVLAPVGLILI